MKKKYLLTPGPSPVPAEVLAKEGMPIMHHRTSEFSEMFKRVEENLKEVYATKNDVLIIASSGTGAMEAAVFNTLSSNSKSVVCETGVFGARWSQIIKSAGLESLVLAEEYGDPVNLATLKKTLSENNGVTAVFGTLTETSTGVVNDIQAMVEIAHEYGAILVMDAISGIGGQEFLMDEWGVDVVVAGSQKGLMIPPGLAFISLNERAWELAAQSDLPKFYFDLKKYRSKVAAGQTPFTPPVSLIAGLDESLKMITQEGIQNVWQRHQKMAVATRAAVQALGLELFSSQPCDVVTAIKVPLGIDGGKIVKILREKYGVSIAGGQLSMKGKIFRIAHMGYMERFDLIIGITAIEMVLKELGVDIELGKGVSVAEKHVLGW
ncbi:MAG: alanine--glyoxylate aminotransferase family protein [bacterium]|nr:alanine--glyoxylate aminotransferase family protein [bacterium]